MHGETIKRPVVDDVDASKGRKAKVARLTDVTLDEISDHLSRAAKWEKYDARAKKHVPTNLSRDGEWRLPRAAGVTTRRY